MADLTRYLWSGNTLVTASELGHPGVNVYIAGGGGVSGSIPVQILGSSGSGNTVDITGPLVGGAVHITGSVWVLNPSSGSGGGGDVNITASITLPVSQTNVPATQSVYIVNQTSGKVEISGTASVSVTNLPATQSVFIEGGTGLSGAVPVMLVGSSGSPGSVVTIAGPLFGGAVLMTPTGTMDAALSAEAVPVSLENLQYTRKTTLFDLASDSVNYIGYAVLGSSAASASWTIKRMNFDASGNLEQISWSSTASIWNNRSSEVYS